jgi:hypothetical protein
MTIVRCTQARMDSLSVLVTFAACLAYLTQREKSLARALFFGNSLAAFGMIVHPNGLFGVAGITLLEIFYDRKSLRPAHLFWFGLPYVIVGAAYGLYALQEPQAWAQQLGGHASGRANGILHPLDSIVAEITQRYFTSFGFAPGATLERKLYILTLVPYAVAPLICLFDRRIRRMPGVAFLLASFWVIQFYFTFLEGGKYYAYLLHIMPYYTCFVAIAAVHLFLEKPGWRPVVMAVLGALVLFQVGGAAMTIRQNIAHNIYKDVVQRMDARLIASRHETVLGPSEFGFYFGFDHVRDDRSSRSLVTERPLYAIIPLVPYARLEDEAAKWAPLVSATLNDCYEPPEVIGPFELYRRKPSCSAGRLAP